MNNLKKGGNREMGGGRKRNSCPMRPTTVISHYSQCFFSHHNYSFKSLFTVFILSQLQLYVIIHRGFFSHHNYSLKSLFTVFFSSQL